MGLLESATIFETGTIFAGRRVVRHVKVFVHVENTAVPDLNPAHVRGAVVRVEVDVTINHALCYRRMASGHMTGPFHTTSVIGIDTRLFHSVSIFKSEPSGQHSVASTGFRVHVTFLSICTVYFHWSGGLAFGYISH